jgi:hypothetical protein
MTNSGVKKYNYAHCRRPFYVEEGGQYAQGPGQPMPPPPNQAPMPPPQYPQYPPQQYPPQYQPPPTQPPMGPPKKSKGGLVIVVMLLVIVLIVALLAYMLVLAPGGDEDIPTITIKELNDDIQTSETGMDFKSYDKGDEIYVTGIVEKIKIAEVPSDTVGVSSGTWTIIFFENPNATTVVNNFAYKGDLRSDYTVGEEGKIKIKIDELSIMGISSEFPKQWFDATMVGMYIDIPTAALDFTETSSGVYTGGLISSTSDIYLNDINIEIEDSSSGSYGYDDGDLTDDNPEEVEDWYENLLLEFTDVNDNDKLDAGDIFTLTNAEPGDIITIYDSDSYEEIVSYTII